MSGLTPIPWRRFEKFLLYAGCTFARSKGDHRIYWRSDLRRPIVIPTGGSLPIFVIRNNLRPLGFSPKDFLDILRGL